VVRPSRHWAFITSHGFVLLHVSRNANATVREIAAGAELTERQAHRILGDLETAGYLTRERVGRRNRYRINEAQPMRHPTLAAHRIGELLEMLGPAPGSDSPAEAVAVPASDGA
jgi:DNA-binding MarR family transcriptional regulator